MIHLVFILRNGLSGWSDVYWSEYLEVFFGSILLIGLSYLPFSFYGRYSFFQNLVGAPKNKSSNSLELTGEQKARTSIQPDLIIYIKSDDNYVDIVSRKPGGELEKEVFRSRLKWVEAQLKPYSQILRVHRSFLINLKYFKSMDSNKVRLEYEDNIFEIPLSRSYRKSLLELIPR